VPLVEVPLTELVAVEAVVLLRELVVVTAPLAELVVAVLVEVDVDKAAAV